MRVRGLSGFSFRVALLYAALFAASTLLLLGFVYLATVGAVERQTDATIQAEIEGLAEHYRLQGLPGLIDVIQARSAAGPGRRGLYLLADARFRPLAGNLRSWPGQARDEPGWVDFQLVVEEAGGLREDLARARTFLLPEGLRLLVGRDASERTRLAELFGGAALGAFALALALGALGGALTSRALLRRLDGINRTASKILAGDLAERMPVGRAGDEFDELARHLNAMLDRLHRLMSGMRGIADSIAHDLRTPISRLRSRLELALMSDAEGATGREALERAVAELDSVLAAFNALLNIGLAESGALRDRFAEVDLAVLVRDAAELYEPAAGEKGVRLEATPGAGAVVMGDRHLLAQAVANLLDNAVKYTPEGGLVTIEATRSGGTACLVVTDSGPGVAPQDRERALERFARLDAARSAPGSGLGLSLVRAVAELHGATLRLEDNAPGLRVVLELEAA